MRFYKRIVTKPFWKELFYYFSKKLPMIFIGKVKKNLIYAYWGHSLNNFGDLLTPMLLKHYGLTPVFSYPHNADLVSVGTLLGLMKPDFKGWVLGTGINQPGSKPFPLAKVIGLRGSLTQKALCPNIQTITLGDPGLLASRIFPQRAKKKWKLGIVPHLSEINHPVINKWEKELKNGVKVIHVLRDPEVVIQEIDSCEYIISSSLHGLVVADSLEIPNIRYIIEDFYEYNYFRFEDYYSALGVPYEWIHVNGNETIHDLMLKFRTDFSMLEPIKDNLDFMFRDFVSTYLKNYYK